jgi:hypothetical protein
MLKQHRFDNSMRLSYNEVISVGELIKCILEKIR